MRSQAQANLKGSLRLGGYLKKLRAGYGYSLRRVEERARAEGGEIDNSQLSRYEKGICYPSFDKLRILANVFNVSIQSFSDIVDLEAYEELKPELGDPSALIEDGIDSLKSGDNGQAFATLERALEMLLESRDDLDRREMIARARINQAAALIRLGKLALAEQELRNALRVIDGLSGRLSAQALLALANIHADQGDNFLSEMTAERAYNIAKEESLDRLAAMAVHTLAHGLSEQGHTTQAIQRYREAAKMYSDCKEVFEATRVRINIGACYVTLGKTREGIRMLRASLNECRESGYRRLESHAWSNLGEAYYQLKDGRRARGCFRESDSLAVFNDEKQPDLLFRNAFYEWKMAVEEENPTREKIAFGRLKLLRSSLERRLPEVEAFDDFVERGRSDA